MDSLGRDAAVECKPVPCRSLVLRTRCADRTDAREAASVTDHASSVASSGLTSRTSSPAGPLDQLLEPELGVGQEPVAARDERGPPLVERDGARSSGWPPASSSATVRWSSARASSKARSSTRGLGGRQSRGSSSSGVVEAVDAAAPAAYQRGSPTATITVTTIARRPRTPSTVAYPAGRRPRSRRLDPSATRMSSAVPGRRVRRLAHDGPVRATPDDGVAAIERRLRAEDRERGRRGVEVGSRGGQRRCRQARQASAAARSRRARSLRQAYGERPRRPVEQQADLLARGDQPGAPG